MKTSDPNGSSDRSFSKAYYSYIPIDLIMAFPDHLRFCSSETMELIVFVPGKSIMFSMFLFTCQSSNCSSIYPNYWVNKLLCLECYHKLWKYYLVLFIMSISVGHNSINSMISWTSFNQDTATLLQGVSIDTPLLPFTLTWSHRGGRQV